MIFFFEVLAKQEVKINRHFLGHENSESKNGDATRQEGIVLICFEFVVLYDCPALSSA